MSNRNKNRKIEDLFSAIVSGNSKNAKDIVSEMDQEDLTKISASGELPISEAAQREQVDVVNEIIKKSGASVISQDAHGETVLHSAANSARSTMQVILQGGDANKTDMSGQKPQDHAEDEEIARTIASKSLSPKLKPKSWVEIMKEKEDEEKNNGRF